MNPGMNFGLGPDLQPGPRDMQQDNTQSVKGLIREAKAEGLPLITAVSVYFCLSSSSGLTSFLFSFALNTREIIITKDGFSGY
jgi:hypothetical protein